MHPFVFALLLTLLPSFSYAQQSCIDIFKKVTTDTSQDQNERIAKGVSSIINQRLLRNLETVPKEVLDRYREEMRKIPSPTRRQSQQLILQYIDSPTRANLEALFKTLRVLVPIASRPLLHRLKNREALEDYLQTGYLNLWERVSRIKDMSEAQRIAMESIFYVDGTLNNLRAGVFAAMRKDFAKDYSLTPVSISKSHNFTFEESILLFAQTPKDLVEIATLYGRPIEEAQREYDLQRASSEGAGLAEITESPFAAPHASVQESQAREYLTKILLTSLTPRQELVVRLYEFNGLSMQAIADRLDLSISRVGQIYDRALERLKKYHTDRYRATHPEYLAASSVIELGHLFRLPPIDRAHYDPIFRREQRDIHEDFLVRSELRNLEVTDNLAARLELVDNLLASTFLAPFRSPTDPTKIYLTTKTLIRGGSTLMTEFEALNKEIKKYLREPILYKPDLRSKTVPEVDIDVVTLKGIEALEAKINSFIDKHVEYLMPLHYIYTRQTNN